MKEYDIIVVGSGAGGVFIAYELAKLDIDASVLILDKGGRLADRRRHTPSGTAHGQEPIRPIPAEGDT